jgi:hypothetical protein
MKSIEIFLSSRNNYKMLPIFLENIDLEGFKLSNIDDHSSAKEIALGKDICKKNQIPFIHNLDRGLQWAWKTFIDTVPIETKFIVWCTHDAYPLSNGFFTKLNEIVEQGSLDNFGVVGFNYFGPMVGISNQDNIEKDSCGILAKTPLMKTPGKGGWYRSGDMDLDWETYGRPFAVESPADFGWMMNVKLFKEIIEPSNKYHLFGACEDLSYQFLKNNIYNVVLPDFVAWHNQEIKEQVSIPKNSANRFTKLGLGKKYFGDYGPHLAYWKEKWGWDRNDRESFEKIKDLYQGTLIRDFYEHDYTDGPLKYFDI